jgi:hypothetical protein
MQICSKWKILLQKFSRNVVIAGKYAVFGRKLWMTASERSDRIKEISKSGFIELFN